MRAKRTTRNLYDDDAFLCPVSQEFIWMDEDDSWSPLATDALVTSPRLSVERALAECGTTYGTSYVATALRLTCAD